MLVTDKNKLRTMSQEWNGKIDELKKIVGDLYDTMEKHKGAGISAIQIGLPYRIFLAGQMPDPELFMNPKVLERSSFTKSDYEGCLSCGDMMVKIKR